MRNYFKFFIFSIVLACIFNAKAGSYEDFFKAIQRDDAGTVKSLLQRGFDPNTRDPNQQHGLYLALREPSLKVAQVLADWPQTDLSALNAQDESALMMATLRGHNDMAKRLVTQGADVNKTGWTPLHYAATAGNVELIALLLEHHAYIDAESPNGSTPLMMAAHYASASAVKLLLESGADPLLYNTLKLSAIDFAQRANKTESADLIATFVRTRQPKGKW
jgi:uncharacterized protein